MPFVIDDVKQALRHLAKPPGFTLAAILSLALGIGASTLIFSVVDAVLLRPLPYRDAGRLVAIWSKSQRTLAPFFQIEGQAVRSERRRASVIHTQPGYCRAAGIPILQGRDFKEADDARASRVVIINESIFRIYFGTENPIGRRLKLDSWTLFGERTQENIGVAADVRHRGLAAVNPIVYLPLAQAPRQGSQVVMKTEGDPRGDVSAVRAAVRAMDQNQPIEDIQTLDQTFARSIAKDRYSAVSVGAFSVFALTLAIVGLYGLVSYATSRRTHEIAIRITLGASRRDVIKLIVRQGMTLAAAGIAVGLAGSLALTRLISSLLFGVRANDPLTFAAVTGVLGAVTIIACWIPAARAMKLDPAASLRM